MQKKSKQKQRKNPHFELVDDGFTYHIPINEIINRLGIHPKTIYRWQKGTQTPDKNTLALMKILFIGRLPWPGWNNFRIRNSNEQTYHNQPIYRLLRIGSRLELNPSQLENWGWTAAADRDQLKHIKEQLDAVMAEREALLRRVNALDAELQRTRDQLQKAEVIQLHDRRTAD